MRVRRAEEDAQHRAFAVVLPGPPLDEELAAAEAHVLAVVLASGTSFYWGMRLLPAAKRKAMYAIYAFCREVDDVADGDAPTPAKLGKQILQPQFNIYAPLTYTTWYVIGLATYVPGQALPPIGFKLASWSAHAFAAAAAWWAIWGLVRHRPAAVVGALVVALHPLQVESVAWTTGLKDVLCGAFSFLAIAFDRPLVVLLLLFRQRRRLGNRRFTGCCRWLFHRPAKSYPASPGTSPRSAGTGR